MPYIAISLQEKQKRFIRKSILKHGNKYGYDKVRYVGVFEKVIIICYEHGDFLQRPNDHMYGAGCSICAKINRIKDRVSDLTEFKNKAIKVHGNRYGYDKVKYINNHTKAVITCLVHGDFEQTPNNHLNGQGCLKCYNEKRYLNNRFTLDVYISKAKIIHGDLYDYSKSIYNGANSKLIIICKKHGEFSQTANDHLRGNGCPVCKASKGEIAILQILQKHNIDFKREYIIPDTENKYRYDFYLPKHNLLIEFHGEQHYRPIDCFGGKEGFEINLFRDSIKRDMAKAWGYKLICVKYTLLKDLVKEEFEKRLLKYIHLLS